MLANIFLTSTPCPEKRCHWFFCCNFYRYWWIFIIFLHNFTRECQSHRRKNFLPYICYVATIPCESLRHKSNTFHTILALCTCLYLSHLGQPVLTKQTKHSRKPEAQNLCSKCPTFRRTHAFKRLYHCTIAAAMTVCMFQQPLLPQQTFFQLSTHIMDPRAVDPLLKHTPDAVVRWIQIWRIRWPHLWRDKLWRLSLQHDDSVTCTMCWCPILLKNVVIPENRADIQQKHIQQNCIPVIVTVDLNPGSKKCSCV